jgi:hypothetical protein
MSSEHELKTWPPFFNALLSGDKTFEARRNDRGFAHGDVLVLREWEPGGGYTGRSIRAVVTYMLHGGGGLGVESGYAVMGIRIESAQPRPVDLQTGPQKSPRGDHHE